MNFLLIKNEEFFSYFIKIKYFLEAKFNVKMQESYSFYSYLIEVEKSINEHNVHHKTMTLRLMFDW